MAYLSVDNIKNNKHREFIRKVSDAFDNHRGNIPDNLALTVFKDQSNHKILVNTLSPGLNGKQLILVDNNEGVLLAPIDVQSIVCSDKRNNESVGLLSIKNNQNVWEAISDDKIIKLLLRFNEPKVTIAGFSVQFADTTKTRYRLTATMVNDDNEIISQVGRMETSFESNSQQFFQFSQPVEGVNRVIIDMEVVGTNVFEWKVKNVSLYTFMNQSSLKALNDSGVLTWTLVGNSVLIREGQEFDEEEQPKSNLTSALELSEQNRSINAIPIKADMTSLSEYQDSYGSPLDVAPDTTRQYFDNLTMDDMKRISSVKRVYTTTKLNNGKEIYTFETDPNTKSITFTFSPTVELNRNTDEPETELEALVEKGYIRNGGFKNYCLTFYIKLDDISMTDQNLIWKYGGWLFNDQLQELARSTDVFIPIGKGTPSVASEYRYQFYKEIKDNVGALSFKEFDIIPDGKWVGFQFIRSVVDKNLCKITVRMNKVAFNDKGVPEGLCNLENWVTILTLDDTATDEHIANTWGGINEYISVTGAKYVSLYGISLYELKI